MSVGFTATLVPNFAVPGFPGAMKSSDTAFECDSFHATACSRAPLPTRSTRFAISRPPRTSLSLEPRSYRQRVKAGRRVRLFVPQFPVVGSDRFEELGGSAGRARVGRDCV